MGDIRQHWAILGDIGRPWAKINIYNCSNLHYKAFLDLFNKSVYKQIYCEVDE